MTIQMIDGFDMYNGTGANTGIQGAWSGVTTVRTTMQTGRFGGQCVRGGGQNNSGATSLLFRTFSSAGVGAVGVGIAVKVDGLAGLSSALSNVMFFLTDSAGTTQVGLAVANDGTLTAYRLTGANAGTALGSSASGAIVNSTWHFIEFGVAINGSTGTITVKVDGATKITLTGQNTQNGLSTVSRLYLSQALNLPSPDVNNFSFDDLYVVDSTTTLGEQRVETLRAASDNTKVWAPNSGTTNFSRVNETLVDGDTSYVSSSNVGDRDLYAIGALSSTPASIAAVQVSSFAEKTDATTRTIANSVQSAGTDSDGSSFSLAASYGKIERIMPTDPNGGGSWTPSRVNGLLIGPKLAS